MGDERENTLIDEVREGFTLKTFQERVWRLEAENRDLKVHNGILQTQYTSSSEQQAEHLRHLHAELDEKIGQIEELENKLTKAQGDLDDEKERAKNELEMEKAKMQKDLEKLQKELETLQNELEKVNEFRINKAEMEAELASLKSRLQQQDEDHKKNVSAFDRKKAIEIDQLKQDMRRSIKETKEMLRNRTKDQLDTTTKRTIMENEQMATELHFQSKQTEQLLARNQSLMDENAQLKRNLLIHKDLENELARRTHVYQKLVKKMGQKKKTDDRLPDTLTGNEEEISIALQQESTRELEPEDSRGNVASSEETERLKRQVEGIQSTLSMVRQEFAHYRRDHATLTQLQDQSTRLIIATLYELKNQRECDPFPPATYDENANWQFSTMTSRQKEYFFRVLLEKLNSSMCGTCFPTGPCGSTQNASASSLPQLVKGGEGQGQSAAHFSQFLWSVATHGAQGGLASQQHSAARKDLMNKGCQTETDPTDPCFREGFWNPQSRLRYNESSARDSPTVSTAVVTSDVRPWGSHKVAAPKRRAIAGRVV
jgi:myosin heavy subunit